MPLSSPHHIQAEILASSNTYGHVRLPSIPLLLFLYLQCYLSSHLQSDDIMLVSSDTYLQNRANSCVMLTWEY